MTESAAPTGSSQTITTALRAARRRLAAASESPRLDAEVLLRHVLGIDRAALFVRANDHLEPGPLAAFERLVAGRVAGAPVAYLVGEREFMGLPFVVRPGVLVPRPETEGLVEWALAWLAGRGPATVVDIGTGSGAIALSLGALLPVSRRDRIVAADLSVAAMPVAAENRAHLGLTERVHLVCGDLAAWCGGPVDLILANLPYLRPDQVAGNPALAAEPTPALLGGDDGLDLIRRLVADVPRLLAAGGALGLEIDPSQAEEAGRLVTTALPPAAVRMLPDLAGRPRHLLVERASQP